MKLGEIKLEALRMMRAEKPSELFFENLEFLKESEGCEEYLLGMPGAINRCFADIEAKGVLVDKCARLIRIENGKLKMETGEIVEDGNRVGFDLTRIISDYGEFVRLICSCEYYYDPSFEYDRIGDTVTFKIPEGCNGVSVVYKPRIARVFSYTPEDEEIGLPDGIACLVPYFIVSELYSQDEPDAAARAREYYEAGILTQIRAREGIQGKVVTRYSYIEVT